MSFSHSQKIPYLDAFKHLTTGHKTVFASQSTEWAHRLLSPQLVHRHLTSLPEASSLQKIYVQLLRKVMRGDEFIKIAQDFPGVECIQETKEKSLVFRVWLHGTSGEIVSRILYVSLNQYESILPQIFFRVLGNVDLVRAPSQLALYDDQSIEWCLADRLKDLPLSLLQQVSRYFDHGQFLNFSGIIKMVGQEPFLAHFASSMSDIYNQAAHDFCYYAQHAPAGMAMLYPHDLDWLVHQTCHKKKIIETGQLSVSKGGCLGNVVYTSKVLQSSDGQSYLSGLTIGISERLAPETDIDQTSFFLLKHQEPGNQISNWINSIGFGRIKLEGFLALNQAAKDFLQTDDAYQTVRADLRQSSLAALKLYAIFRPVLDYIQGYANRRRFLNGQLNEGRQLKWVDQEFDRFWPLFDKARHALETNPINSLDRFHLLNGIFFEVLKDYVILHQQTAAQRDHWSQLGSFDMHNQYQFFFSIDERLKTGFDTGGFSPKWDIIISALKAHSVSLESPEELNQLKEFILNRFSTYINLFLLEGGSFLPRYRHLERKHSLYHFLELAQVLPNLAGSLFHSVFMDYYGLKKVSESSVTLYQTEIQRIFTLSYNERGITLPIKANICATDEVGVRASAHTTLHHPSLHRENKTAYRIVDASEELKIRVHGVSTVGQLRRARHSSWIDCFTLKDLPQFMSKIMYCDESNQYEAFRRLLTLLKDEKEINAWKGNRDLIDLLESRVIDGTPPMIMECVHAIYRLLFSLPPKSLKYIYTMLEIFKSILISDYHTAIACLHTDARQDDFDLEFFIEMLFLQKDFFSEYLQASILCFLSQFYMDKTVGQADSNIDIKTLLLSGSEVVNASSPGKIKQATKIEDLGESFISLIKSLLYSRNRTTRLMVVQLLFYWIKKNDLHASQLLLPVLIEADDELYIELANFVNCSGWIFFDNTLLTNIHGLLMAHLGHAERPALLLKALAHLSMRDAASELFTQQPMFAQVVIF